MPRGAKCVWPSPSYLVSRELNLSVGVFQDVSSANFDFELVRNVAEKRRNGEG